ncbi:MAG: hypothetical protein ACRCZZ_03530, partial [Phocaeicola sp.]
PCFFSSFNLSSNYNHTHPQHYHKELPICFHLHRKRLKHPNVAPSREIYICLTVELPSRDNYPIQNKESKRHKRERTAQERANSTKESEAKALKD